MNERIIEFISNAPEPGPVPSPEYVDSAAQTGDPILWMLIVIITIATLSILTTISINKNQMIKNGFEAVAKRINTHKMILAIILSMLLLGAGQIIALSCNKTKAFAEDEPENKITAVVDYKTGQIVIDSDQIENNTGSELGIYSSNISFTDGSQISAANWTISSFNNTIYQGSAGNTYALQEPQYLEINEILPIKYNITADFNTAQSLVGKTAIIKFNYSEKTVKYNVTVDTKPFNVEAGSITKFEQDGWVQIPSTTQWVKGNIDAFTPIDNVMGIWNTAYDNDMFELVQGKQITKWVPDVESLFISKDTKFEPETRDCSYISLHQNISQQSKVTITEADGSVSEKNMKYPAPEGGEAGLVISVAPNTKVNIIVNPNLSENDKWPILTYDLDSYAVGQKLHQGVTILGYEGKEIKGVTNPKKANVEIKYTEKTGTYNTTYSDVDGKFSLIVNDISDGTLTITDPDDPNCIFIRSYSRLSQDVDLGTINLTKCKISINRGEGWFVNENVPAGWIQESDDIYYKFFYENSYIEDAISPWGHSTPLVTAIAIDTYHGWLKWDYDKDDSGTTYLEENIEITAIFAPWLNDMPTEVKDTDGRVMGEVVYIGDKNKVRKGCTFENFLDGFAIFDGNEMVCSVQVKYNNDFEYWKHATNWAINSGSYYLVGCICEPTNFYFTEISDGIWDNQLAFEYSDEWYFDDSDKQILNNSGWIELSNWTVLSANTINLTYAKKYLNLLGVTPHQSGKEFTNWAFYEGAYPTYFLIKPDWK